MLPSLNFLQPQKLRTHWEGRPEERIEAFASSLAFPPVLFLPGEAECSFAQNHGFVFSLIMILLLTR
jgi:hypothetical protein